MNDDEVEKYLKNLINKTIGDIISFSKNIIFFF